MGSEKISRTQAYKVLDVKEYFTDLKGYLYTNNDCNINGRHIFAVICKDEETGERRRFHFFEGYTRQFLNEENYYGYSGDYNLLVPGDRFKIIQTDTYKKVKILADVKNNDVKHDKKVNVDCSDNIDELTSDFLEKFIGYSTKPVKSPSGNLLLNDDDAFLEFNNQVVEFATNVLTTKFGAEFPYANRNY